MTPASELERLETLKRESTQVVSWYAHSQGDGYHLGKASVRGPFGRWFLVQGGDNGMGDPVKYPVPVADLYADAKYAAAAMNALPGLIQDLRSAMAENVRKDAEVQSTRSICQEILDRETLLLDECIRLKSKLGTAREALEYTKKSGPTDGETGACVWCDMGGSGYSSKGDGHHDDIRRSCPIVKASQALTALDAAGRSG